MCSNWNLPKNEWIYIWGFGRTCFFGFVLWWCVCFEYAKSSTFGAGFVGNLCPSNFRGEEATAESCGRLGRKTPEQQLAWFQWTLCSDVALLVFDVKDDFDLPAWTLLDLSNRDKQDPKHNIWFVLQFEQGLNLCNYYPAYKEAKHFSQTFLVFKAILQSYLARICDKIGPPKKSFASTVGKGVQTLNTLERPKTLPKWLKDFKSVNFCKSLYPSLFAPLKPWMPCRAASGFQPDLIVSASGGLRLYSEHHAVQNFTAKIPATKKLLVGWKTYCILEYSKCLFAHSIFLVAKALSLWFSTSKKMKTNKTTHISVQTWSFIFFCWKFATDLDAKKTKKNRLLFVVFVVWWCVMIEWFDPPWLAGMIQPSSKRSSWRSTHLGDFFVFFFSRKHGSRFSICLWS